MHKVHYYVFLLIILLMGSVSLFATDIYVPALPEMAKYFRCHPSEIQASFTVFFLGLALCQLVSGILADAFGRKRVLLVGFSVFTLASWYCAQAQTLTQFLNFRLLQAISGGVGSVVFRALIVDRFDQKDSAKLFSIVFPVIGLSGALAPLVGGYLTSVFNWQATFLFISGFGVTLLVLILFCLEEQKSTRVDAVRPTHRVKGYFSILRSSEFLGYAFIVCSCFCVFRSYTVESPFVFNRQGYLPEQIGKFYLSLSLTYLLGSLLGRSLMDKIRTHRIVRLGMMVFVSGGVLMLWAAWLYAHNPYAIIAPMAIIALGNGLLFPISSAGALASVSNRYSGSAAGLMGAIQFVAAAFCTRWIGKLCLGKAFPLAVFMSVIIVVGLLSYWFFLDKSDDKLLVTVEDS